MLSSRITRASFPGNGGGALEKTDTSRESESEQLILDYKAQRKKGVRLSSYITWSFSHSKENIAGLISFRSYRFYLDRNSTKKVIAPKKKQVG